MTIDNSQALNAMQSQPKIDETNGDLKKLREQTDKFEALILKSMLDKSLKMENSILPEQPGGKIYKAMYRETLSEELAGSFGYSDLLFNYLKEKMQP